MMGASGKSALYSEAEQKNNSINAKINEISLKFDNNNDNDK